MIPPARREREPSPLRGMLRSRRCLRGTLGARTALTLLLAVSVAPVASSSPLLDETARMQRLARVQADPRAELAPFTSDGCSGGMSLAWRSLAELSEQLRDRFGEHPPWEACCVAHDRSYWRGETQDGYARRLQADEELRACVSSTGRSRAQEIGRQLGWAPERVEEGFAAVSELMYSAVRAGGGPCTGLPWRWGYGWPQCPAAGGQPQGDQ